jgi:hypothetical protein
MRKFINILGQFFTESNSKKNFYVIFFFLIIIFLIPIYIYGIVDQEEYGQSIFSTKFAFNNPSLIFEDFIDLLGIGSSYPIANFLLHPSIFFLNNIKLYYLSFVFLNLSVQCFFLKRLLILFNQHLPNFLLIFFTIFSNSNFNYVYSDDWPSVLFGHSFFYAGFFYLIKFLLYKNILSFYKLITISVLITNFGPLSTSIFIILFFFITFLIFADKKTYKNYYYYIGLLIFIICNVDLINWFIEYFQFSEEKISSIKKIPISTILNKFLILFFISIFFFLIILIIFFKLKFLFFLNKFSKRSFKLFFILTFFFSLITIVVTNYGSLKFNYLIIDIPIIFLLGNFLNSFFFNETLFSHPINRYFFNGIEFFLILYLFNYFNKSNKKKINYLLIFLFIINYFTFLTPFKIFKILSIEGFIKINFFLFFILSINHFWNHIKNNKIFIFLLIIAPFAHYLTNINNIKSQKNNYFKNEIRNLELIKNLKNIAPTTPEKIVLSNNLSKTFRYDLSPYGIYGDTDLIYYNLYPINLWCKKCLIPPIVNTYKLSFYGQIAPDIDDLNNILLYYFFNIKYLGITSSDINYLNLDKFELILKTKLLNNDEILIYKIIEQKNLIYISDLNNLENCNNIKCFLNKKNFKESDSISIMRTTLNNYLLNNSSNENLKYIFPINNIYNKWVAKNAKFYSKKGFLFIELPSKSSIEIFYNNINSKNLRKLSFYAISLLLLIINLVEIFYFFRKKKFKFI